MRKRSKNYRNALKLADLTKIFDLKQAVDVLKKISYAKFNASVDLALRLGVDPRQANQMVRGVALLPHGTGKEVRVLVLTSPEKQPEAQQAGAEFVGLEDYIAKIEQGWTDVDVIICSPDVMPKVGRLGKILGPRGLMPNPKSGTVTADVAKAVKEVKAGKIDFKVDKTGILHCAIGKVNFTNEQIIENATELIQTVQKLKPAAAKDTFFLSIYMSSTMSPSIQIDKSSIAGIQ
jgi:large subunit ribosomal protein L1